MVSTPWFVRVIGVGSRSHLVRHSSLHLVVAAAILMLPRLAMPMLSGSQCSLGAHSLVGSGGTCRLCRSARTGWTRRTRRGFHHLLADWLRCVRHPCFGLNTWLVSITKWPHLFRVLAPTSPGGLRLLRSRSLFECIALWMPPSLLRVFILASWRWVMPVQSRRPTPF